MKYRALIIIIFSIFTLSFTSQGKKLTANVASIDITPPIEMKYTLGGYGERMNKPAEAIHDHIMAKALSLKMGDRKYLIITLDLLGIPSNVKSDLIKRVHGMGWGLENMMFLPSHSHGSLEMAALNSKNLLNNPNLGIFQPELLAFLMDKLEILVREADKNYQPVKIGTESRVLEGLNRNRRNDPDIDKELIVTRIDLNNGKPLAVLVNWTAHPTFLGGQDMLVSAEWPGYLQTNLQNLIGQGVTTMYFNGSEGDQSTILSSDKKGYEKIAIYGKIIADKAFEVFKDIKPREVKEFKYSYGIVPLPEHAAHPSFMKTGGEEYGLNEKTVKIVMDVLGPSEVGMGAVRIGDLVISGIPGELTAILGQKVKNTIKENGIKYVAIGGLANEWIGYILSRDQYLHGEGYESSMSFYGPDFGEAISTGAIKTALPLIGSK
jgi:neutral ceramidase